MGKALSHDFEKLAPYYDFALKILFFFFGGEARLRAKIASFLSCGNFKKGAKILEVGSGTGSNLKALDKVFPGKYELIGVDSSPSMISEAKKKGFSSKTTFLLGDAEKLPFKNKSVEAVLTVFTLHELPEKKRKNAIKEIHRVLKKSGFFLVVDFTIPKNIFGKFLFFFLRAIESQEALKFAISGFKAIEKDYPFKKKKEGKLLLGLAEIALYKK